MLLTPKWKPIISSITKAATEDFGQLTCGNRWIAVSSSQPLLVCSGSTHRYSHIASNSNYGAYNAYNNPEENEGITFPNEVLNEQVTYFQSINDQNIETTWINIHFGPECTIVTATTGTASPTTTDTGSNLQEEDYRKSISAEIDSTVEELAYLLQLEPIEDGYFHPAEQLIGESLISSKFDPTHWIYTTYYKNIDTDPILAAAVLRLLGRFPHSQVGEWGIMIAIIGLSHRDIEVRDAAVRALERWGGQKAFKALKAHLDIEPIPWLAAYIKQVIIDLED